MSQSHVHLTIHQMISERYNKIIIRQRKFILVKSIGVKIWILYFTLSVRNNSTKRDAIRHKSLKCDTNMYPSKIKCGHIRIIEHTTSKY